MAQIKTASSCWSLDNRREDSRTEQKKKINPFSSGAVMQTILRQSITIRYNQPLDNGLPNFFLSVLSILPIPLHLEMDASRFHLSNMYPPLPSHNRRRLIMDYVDNKRHQLALLFFLFFVLPPTPTMSGVLDSWSRDSPPPLYFLINPPSRFSGRSVRIHGNWTFPPSTWEWGAVSLGDRRLFGVE